MPRPSFRDDLSTYYRNEQRNVVMTLVLPFSYGGLGFFASTLKRSGFFWLPSSIYRVIEEVEGDRSRVLP